MSFDQMSERARADQHVSRVMNAAHTQDERTQRAYIASQLYSKVGEYDKALSYIDMYLTAHHTDAGAFYLRGYILEKKGRMEDAISAYCSSLSQKPKQKEVIIKICEVVCSIERPPEDQLSKWLEQARKVLAPQRLIESLREKLALAKADSQELENIYNEQIKRNPDDLLAHRKMINFRLILSDLTAAKRHVDQINFRLPQANENLDWIQVCYSVYSKTYASCLSTEGANPQFEVYPILSGMLGFLSSTFILKLTSEHKQPKDTLRHFDSHLSALYSTLERSPVHPTQRLPYQLRFKEHFAHFYQLCAYLLLKLAYDQVLDVSEMLQLAAVCLSISFSITPPSTRDESTEGILHVACSRMCEVGYLMAALARLNGQEWLQRTVKPRISVEGISRIIEVLELHDTRQTPSCLRMHTIDISQVQCTSPSRNHLVRYHDAYIRDHLYQLPYLTWLSLAEVSAYGGHPSLPHSFSFSENRFKSFPDGSEDLSRTDCSSCSRMDIESFLYMSLYETQQLESTAESGATVLLPLVLHKLSIPEARCTFWISLISLERAPQNNISIKDACKHKTIVEKGLFSIRCLKKMELPTLIVFNIAEAFEQRLVDCSPDSPGYSEEKHSLLLARNELYWTETLRRLEMNEAGVSSLLSDDSISNCLAVKLLSLQGKKAVDGLSEEKKKTIRSRAEMVLADLALHRNHVLKAVSIYEKLDLPQAAWNHSQLLKLVALSGNPSIISGTHPRPPTSYDLLIRSHKILSEWTSREELNQDLKMKQNFENEIESLNKSIHDHRQEDNSPDTFSDNFPDDNFRDAYESSQFNSGTFGQASAPPFSFPPPSAGLDSSPKKTIPNGSDTVTMEEQHSNMQMQFERMTLALKQRDDIISDLSKKNVELKGIVQNLQYYFTDQKVLFKNPKDPENAILRPEDLDNLPTPQIPSTVHNLSGRNLSLSNNSPQYPFNNSGSSNKTHTPLNSTHKSLLNSSYQAELNSDFILSPHTASQGTMFEHEFDEMQQTRPILSLKTKPLAPQTGDQPFGSSPFANLSLTGVGSGQAQPNLVPFQLNLSAPRESGGTTAGSVEEFVCTAEHKALVDLPLIKTETGEESEDVLFCKKGKLFRYRDDKWVERGVGFIKVMQQRNEHKFRLLMRREIVMKLCCNHLILPSLELKPQSDKSVLWSTHADFSEQGEQESLTLAIRFKTSEIKDEFVSAVNKCINILKHSTRLKPTLDIQHISPEKENSPLGSLMPQSAAPPYLISFGPQLPNPRTLLHQPITQSYSDSDDDDTDIISNTSDNEATHDTKGPLRITSRSGEQVIFEEQTSLIVNDSGNINDHGGVKILILGDSDRVQYKILLRKDGTDRFSHDIRDIGDFRPYAVSKSDRSWSWTLNKPDDPQKKLKLIVRFLTTVAAGKFSAIMEDCILKTRTSTVSDTKTSPKIIASTPEKNPKPIFGMGALQGFTFSSQDHGQLFSSTPGTSFMNLLGAPTTPITTNPRPTEESNTSENSYETDPYYEPVVVLPELKGLKTGEEHEEVLFFRRTRLYRFYNKEWKERGIGELKILKNPASGKYRIIMRRDVIKKLCCNHYITPEMTIVKNQSNEKTMNWYTLADFSDEVQRPEQFAARFKTVEIAIEFEETFNRCLLQMETSQSPQKSDQSREPPTKESDTPLTADVVIVSVSQPTEDQIRRARQLMLPDCFYLYEDLPDCPGCRGCDDNFPLEHSSEESDSKTSQTTEQLKMQPTADIPGKPSGSIFGVNLGNLSFSSFVPSHTQASSSNPYATAAKPATNEDRESTQFKLNEPEPVVPQPKLEEEPTGTEGEEKLLVNRCAELRILVDSEWKDQGKGDLKIFHNLHTGKYRLEMRRNIDASVCCNHFITMEMKLVLESDERTWSWNTLHDLSGETPQSIQFCSRFQTQDMAEEFKNVFEGCQEELMNRTLVPFPASTPNTAGSDPVTENDRIPESNSQPAVPSSQVQVEEPLSKLDNANEDDVIFVSAYEPTPEEIAVSEKYQLSRYFFSYEEKKPCPGCRGCDEDFEIIYEKDYHVPVPSEATIVKPSLFGCQVENVVSFTTLAQSDSKQGFTGQGNPFKSYARPLFAVSSEEGGDPQECEPDSHFKPIVQLAEIQDLRTGEEGEKELFNKHTMLFRFDNNQWKERGKGDIKILFNEETNKYRIIMRRVQVKKLCCNHFISSEMNLKPLPKSENCWLWHTNSDSSEEEPRPETLAAKFKKIEFSNEFKRVFEQCVSALKDLENS